ncbi:MAG TPA: 3'-5' exonuclease [Candidatus Saccharimonadales bacterium]|nr:3'-5' exonuclease [Candidatus Saccharimonadales bacterium]
MIEEPIVFVDVETTGGSAFSSRILEIGAVRVENGVVVNYMNQVLDPEETVPGWITELTGIADRETTGKPTFAAVVPQLEQLFAGALFVAHNVTFDYSFFTEEFRRLDRSFDMPRLCTVRLSRALYPAEKSHRLDAVIARHGYEVERRHRAYDDADVLRKFYFDNLEQFGAEKFTAAHQRLRQQPKSAAFM